MCVCDFVIYHVILILSLLVKTPESPKADSGRDKSPPKQRSRWRIQELDLFIEKLRKTC